MPIDNPALRGTEKNGILSNEYCKYCYVNGSFVNPGMTLEEMRTEVKAQMEKRNMDDKLIRQALNTLPELKRWKGLRTAGKLAIGNS
jgi:hypothetical protein